jgi:hypothetical protein
MAFSSAAIARKRKRGARRIAVRQTPDFVKPFGEQIGSRIGKTISGNSMLINF